MFVILHSQMLTSMKEFKKIQQQNSGTFLQRTDVAQTGRMLVNSFRFAFYFVAKVGNIS
jgi:hypothetical protein